MLFFVISKTTTKDTNKDINKDINNEVVTRAEAALYIAEYLNIEHDNNEEKLYGLAYGIFPGDYDGKNDITNYDKEMTSEILLVVLVRYIGWDTVDYDKKIANILLDYVSPEGYPYYQPDPTPRSIPYIASAYSHGLVFENEFSSLREPIGYDTLKKYLIRLKTISEINEDNAFCLMPNSMIETNQNASELLLIDNNFKENKDLYSGEDVILDVRNSTLNIYRGKTNVSGSNQKYFPLGALDTILSVGIEVDKDSLAHQSEAIYATLNNYSTTVNGVALWGEAVSKKKGARVWGGFLTATSVNNNDSQLVGLEIDVTNNSNDGVSPNASKVGAQIVSLGQYTCTNAIEILSADKSSWQNGILVTENSISSDGTIIGVAQTNPIHTGIDFGNTNFSNAAIQIKQNSKLVFKQDNGNPAALYTDEFGYIVIQSGINGLRIVNNDNSANILKINSDGNISEDCLVYDYLINKLSNNTSNNTSDNVIIESTNTITYNLIFITFFAIILFLMYNIYILNKKVKILFIDEV